MSSTKYKSPLCSCIYCKKIQSERGIVSHYLTAHTIKGNNKAKNALLKGADRALARGKERAINNEKAYLISPNTCAHCKKVLPYKRKNNKFCSHSCSTTYYNQRRVDTGWELSIQQRSKIAETLRNRPNKPTPPKIYRCRKCKASYLTAHDAKICCPSSTKPRPKPIRNYDGPFSKICLCRCKVCNTTFYAATQKQFCTLHKNQHSNKRAEFRFRFNIFDYEDIFDLTLLKTVGFYGPGGKSGKWNLTGLSRDHKVSVSDAIKYNYDPYYISHPCNCELMPHSANDKKKGNSSISYDELKRLVNLYDKTKKVVERVGFAPTQTY
jgi:hypothetical protein